METETERGFIESLFDFSFSNFITTKIVRLLYIVGVIVAGIYAIFFIATGFNMGAWVGIFFLLLSPIIFLVFVALARIYLEVIIVIFRIAEHTKKIADQGGASTDLTP